MKNLKGILAAALLLSSLSIHADEGMWMIQDMQMTLIGSFIVSIARTWTDEVWVLRRSGLRCPADTKKVSCMSLAGWFGGKLRASNTW